MPAVGEIGEWSQMPRRAASEKRSENLGPGGAMSESLSSSDPDRCWRIEAKLRERLQARYVEVRDESSLHAGHAGVPSGAGHFSVVVVSPKFDGLGMVEAQRLVYGALEDEMERSVHALRIKTMAE
jgi:BolA protein